MRPIRVLLVDQNGSSDFHACRGTARVRIMPRPCRPGTSNSCVRLAEWEGGNFAAGTNMRGPEVELSTFIRGGKVLCHGTDEIDRYLGEFFAQWRDYHITVERLQPLDEATVVLEGHQHGVGKGSGAKTTDALTIVFKLDRERITVMHWRDMGARPHSFAHDPIDRSSSAVGVQPARPAGMRYMEYVAAV